MKIRMLLVVVSALSVVGAGCPSEEEGELPEVDCAMGPIPTYAEVGAFQKCSACHSSALSGSTARHEAPADINYDTYAGAEAHATKAASEVNEGAMPPADSGITLTAAEKDALYKWSLCGAQE